MLDIGDILDRSFIQEMLDQLDHVTPAAVRTLIPKPASHSTCVRVCVRARAASFVQGGCLHVSPTSPRLIHEL